MQNANVDYVIAQTSNEKIKRGLILANTRLTDAQEELQRTTVDYTKQKTDEVKQNIKLIEKEVEKLSKEINGLGLDNEFKKRNIKEQNQTNKPCHTTSNCRYSTKRFTRKIKRRRSESNTRKNNANVGRNQNQTRRK